MCEGNEPRVSFSGKKLQHFFASPLLFHRLKYFQFETGPFKAPAPLQKEGFPSNPNLLQIFDIKGSALNKVYADKSFKKFATLDDAGIAYILKEIPPLDFNRS